MHGTCSTTGWPGASLSTLNPSRQRRGSLNFKVCRAEQSHAARAVGGIGDPATMRTMLENTDRDIADRNDTDLRALVALLAEATLRRHHLPSSAVTWGADQNAPDGGLNVRVELEAGAAIGGFIPSSSTGFKVKKIDMAPANIRSEMRHGGLLRNSISDLADKDDAYIIASSGSRRAGSNRATSTFLTSCWKRFGSGRSISVRTICQTSGRP